MTKLLETTALGGAVPAGGTPRGVDPTSTVLNKYADDLAFWVSLIDESEAAEFLKLTPRCMQGWRYRGRGPPHIRVSARCIRYRRCDLRDWAEARLRTSTSDIGEGAA